MFYVYVYSSNNIPFYVGKGNKGRDLSHLRAAEGKWKTNRSVCSIECQHLLEAGHVVDVVRVAEGLSEEDAFALEKQLIQKFGKKTEGGTLINRTTGGQGASGRKMSEEQKMAISRHFKGKPLTTEHRLKIQAYVRNNKVKPPTYRGEDHPRARKFEVTFPDGSCTTVKCLKKFCDELGISMSTVRNTLYTKQPIKKGDFAGLIIKYAP
jgi:hypothetical protein